MKIEQNKQNDKLEVERLNKEFIKNQYMEKYKVVEENRRIKYVVRFQCKL